jgi:hypothetical protein
VATPVVVVVLTVVLPLLADATVEPEPGVVVVVDPELEAVFDEDGVLEVFAAVCPPAAAAAALLGEVASDVRSIEPTFVETTLAIGSDPLDAAAALLDPSSLPQAARVSVARAHSTALRMCERAAKVKFVICHYPGLDVKKSPPGQRYVSRTCDITVAGCDPITTNIVACR